MPTSQRLLRLLLWAALALAARPSGADEPRAAPAPAPAPPPADAALLQGATPEELATWRFLEHLGWRFVADPAAAQVQIFPGQPGHRASLAQAQAAGDLLVRVPPTPAGAAELRHRLPQFVDGSATRLAWQLRMEPALRAAVEKLSAATRAGRYKFPPFLLWDSPFFQFHPPPEAWVERARVYYARGPRASSAIEAFYARGGLAECYSAQWLLVYATLYELFGAEGFDAAFRPEEIVVGRPMDLKPTPIGQTMLSDRTYPFRALFLKPQDLRQDAGVTLASLGPKAFVGLTGIVRAQDESDSANQNLTVVEISERACEMLRTKGGMAYVAELGRQAAAAYAGTRGWLASAEAKARSKAAFEALLSDPVLSEWIVYVHPFGAVPLADMFRHEIDDNNRAVYVLLYLHGREDLIYQRFRSLFERRLLEAAAPPR